MTTDSWILLDRLAEALQSAALLNQRIAVTCRQQQIDAAESLAAIERAVAALKSARGLERDAKGGVR